MEILTIKSEYLDRTVFIFRPSGLEVKVSSNKDGSIRTTSKLNIEEYKFLREVYPELFLTEI